MRRAPGLWLATLASLWLAACAAPPAAHRIDRNALDRELARLLAPHGATLRIGLWLGEPEHVLYERDAGQTLPVASAIKTAFLIEFFAAHAGGLDARPADFAPLCADPTHPAFAHFAAPLRAEITRDLAHASVREVGRAMIRGDGVSNGVYNAAANLVTAWLGGPAALTARIHARDPDFASLVVRRYMLARRESGDNEASARGLAAPFQRLLQASLAGVDDDTHAAIRAVLRGSDHAQFGEHLHKSGALDSAPITRVETGAFPSAGGAPLIYVVMLAQDPPARGSAAATGQELGRLALALRDAMLAAALAAPR